MFHLLHQLHQQLFQMVKNMNKNDEDQILSSKDIPLNSLKVNPQQFINLNYSTDDTS